MGRLEPDSPCYLMRVDGDWGAFYRVRFDGKRRKDHRHEWRNLAATGSFSVDFLTSASAESGLTDTIAEIQL